jgi:hypothetical protein
METVQYTAMDRRYGTLTLLVSLLIVVQVSLMYNASKHTEGSTEFERAIMYWFDSNICFHVLKTTNVLDIFLNFAAVEFVSNVRSKTNNIRLTARWLEESH